jgi:hypothetical protein
MNGRALTISDLQAVTGYSRDQMRGLLDALPAYASRETVARVAKKYTAHDLLVVTACVFLETRYGLQRAAVVRFSDELRTALSRPRPVSSTARLTFSFGQRRVSYTEGLIDVQEGLVMPLAQLFQAVDEYLLPEQPTVIWAQRDLGFGPSTIGVPSSQARDQVRLSGGNLSST